MSALLRVRNLVVEAGPLRDPYRLVDGVDLDLDKGEILGVVGESGSGKSLSLLAVTGLLGSPLRVNADEVSFNGIDLGRLEPRARRALMGRDMAMIFQDPVSSLHPAYTIGFQLMEPLKVHLKLRGHALRDKAVELLELVEITAPASRLGAYPHELSGGMCQRVMIAMAIACGPKLLIADEPTTALDVTVQAQVIGLLRRLQTVSGMGLVLVSHDLALVGLIADEVCVMYAGQVVEQARTSKLFARPSHPYTQALFDALPESADPGERFRSLQGSMPAPRSRWTGCKFAPRCNHAKSDCVRAQPGLDAGGAGVRCYFPMSTNAEASHEHV